MYKTIQQQLSPHLSTSATINTDAPSRWSTYEMPKPVAIVHVSSENDVVATVKYCNENNLPFLVQSGGNGWARFPHITNLVLVSMSQLNHVNVSDDKATATIEGGARIKGTVEAADAAGVLLQTGGCNAVGTLGAFLGGGYGLTMGMFGFGIDNILEMRVVIANGELITVSATQNEELFWAMRGAGQNLGIVTSATVKAYAMPAEERVAWSGALVFTEDKLDQVVAAMEDLELSERMVSFMYFTSGGPPQHALMVIATVWMFQASPEVGKEAFKSFYEIGPVMDTTSVLGYTEWNNGGDPFCTHSQRKPGFTAGIDHLDVKVWRKVWTKLVEFQKLRSANGSTVLLETFPMNETRFAGEASAAFPHRKTRFQAVILPWYDDPNLDEKAMKFGKEVRDLLRNSVVAGEQGAYINFCHGDESLDEVYSHSLPRLRKLKKVWDPDNRFNQLFNID